MKQKQILLIESEFYPRVRMDDELAEHGYQVTSVKKVKDAFFKMKTQIFQLLLMSYDQDVNTALRLLATLRQSGNQIPVVLLAKRPTEQQLIQLSAYRPLEIIVKPYSVINLLERMEQIVEQQGAS